MILRKYVVVSLWCGFHHSRFPQSSFLEVCQVVVAEVIVLCGEVASLASPVVCNSSPEGFLPGTEVNGIINTYA